MGHGAGEWETEWGLSCDAGGGSEAALALHMHLQRPAARQALHVRTTGALLRNSLVCLRVAWCTCWISSRILLSAHGYLHQHHQLFVQIGLLLLDGCFLHMRCSHEVQVILTH